MRERVKRPRATAIVEWAQDNLQGVLVYADHRGFWNLPGGDITRDGRGRQEAPLITAARELSLKTSLESCAALFLFRHAGSKNDHHVFLLQATGTLTLVNVHETLAIGLCDFDLTVTPIVAAPGFFASRVQLVSSVKEIISQYHRQYRLQPGRPDAGAAGPLVLNGA